MQTAVACVWSGTWVGGPSRHTCWRAGNGRCNDRVLSLPPCAHSLPHRRCRVLVCACREQHIDHLQVAVPCCCVQWRETIVLRPSAQRSGSAACRWWRRCLQPPHLTQNSCYLRSATAAVPAGCEVHISGAMLHACIWQGQHLLLVRIASQTTKHHLTLCYGSSPTNSSSPSLHRPSTGAARAPSLAGQRRPPASQLAWPAAPHAGPRQQGQGGRSPCTPMHATCTPHARHMHATCTPLAPPCTPMHASLPSMNHALTGDAQASHTHAAARAMADGRGSGSPSLPAHNHSPAMPRQCLRVRPAAPPPPPRGHPVLQCVAA